MSAAREDIRDFLRRERVSILVEVTGAAEIGRAHV